MPSPLGRIRLAGPLRVIPSPSGLVQTAVSLNHPTDLAAWHVSMGAGRHPIRNLPNRVRSRRGPAPAGLMLPPGSAAHVDILIVIESPTASQLASLVAPIRFLAPERVALLTTAESRHRLQLDPSSTWVTITDHQDLSGALPGLRSVLTYGHYMRLGAIADITAREVGATSFVAQHGIITPLAPPLPEGSNLLAWSEADVRFWTSGRSDVGHHIVGSQLLHEAHRGASRDDRSITPATRGDFETPTGITYLGQLHGSELPRRSMASAAVQFCRSTDATYRPHPSERDLVSRIQHALWRRRGIRFDIERLPLRDLHTEVVSVFSTGVLEAAAAGIPSWVHFPDPPEWLDELWQRYSMSRFGSAEPTRVEVPIDEPARTVAEILAANAEESR